MTNNKDNVNTPTEASTPVAAPLPDVPGQVFQKFLETLKESGLSDELVSRLRKALITDKALSDRALRAAVLGEEQSQ